MEKNKKIILLILTLSLSFSLIACGTNENNQIENNNISNENIVSIQEEINNVIENNKNNQNINDDNNLDNENNNNVSNGTDIEINDTIQNIISQYNVSEDTLKWDYNENTKTLIISGEGPMKNYEEEVPAWDDYYDKIEHIIIGNEITSIGNYAFYSYSKLVDVSIGENVEYIGDFAFHYASELRTVNFPSTLQYVGSYAFSNALLHSDNGFILPEGLVYVGDNAFYSAFKESYVQIPSTLAYIGDEAFDNCYVESFIVDENNQNYATIDGVLYSKNIEELINYPAQKRNAIFDVPNTVAKIDKGAIQVTNFLETLNIPSSVVDIEENSIYWNYGLSTINVDENNQNYMSNNGVLYTKDGKNLINYPSNRDGAEYTTLDTTEYICNYAFSQTNNLQKLHLNNGLIKIGNYVFWANNSLIELGLPSTIKNIEESTFSTCNTLKVINYTGSSEAWNNISIAEDNELLNSEQIKIYCLENL